MNPPHSFIGTRWFLERRTDGVYITDMKNKTTTKYTDKSADFPARVLLRALRMTRKLIP